jgi:hypothetical protein
MLAEEQRPRGVVGQDIGVATIASNFVRIEAISRVRMRRFSLSLSLSTCT